MTEEKIQEARERIKDTLNKRKEILDLKKKLIRANQRKNRNSYYAILSKLNFLESYLGGLSTSKIVNHEFNVTGSLDDSCPHDIWYYVGSFKKVINDNFAYEMYVKNEEDEDFSFNRYICFDCGEIRDIRNWKEFENQNVVLKSYDNIDLNKYRNSYHQLLYTMPSSNAVQIITEQFSNEKNILERKLK